MQVKGHYNIYSFQNNENVTSKSSNKKYHGTSKQPQIYLPKNHLIGACLPHIRAIVSSRQNSKGTSRIFKHQAVKTNLEKWARSSATTKK